MGAVIRFAKHKPQRATFDECVRESACSIHVVPPQGDEVLPRAVLIRWDGRLAEIPSMKRGKLPGKNCLNPTVLAKVRAMDALFAVQAHGRNLGFGANFVRVVTVCGERSHSFDLPGVEETVLDWLEPPTKPVGKKRAGRGWGCGLIANDSYVAPTTRHAWQLGLSTRCSLILIEPWNRVEQEEVQGLTTALRAAI